MFDYAQKLEYLKILYRAGLYNIVNIESEKPFIQKELAVELTGANVNKLTYHKSRAEK